LAEIEPNLRTYFLAQSSVTDLISTRLYVDRIDPSIEPTYPLAIMQTIIENTDYAHDGELMPRALIQVDVFSDDKSESVTTATTMRDEVSGYSGAIGSLSNVTIFVSNIRGGWDTGTQRFRRMFDVDVRVNG